MLGMRGKLRKFYIYTHVAKQEALGESGAYSPGMIHQCPACCLDSLENLPSTDQLCAL
jgi:hypothetical protein